MTHTYSILEVSQATFDDVRDRLKKANSLDRYYDERKGVIVLGEVALKVEESRAGKRRFPLEGRQ